MKVFEKIKRKFFLLLSTFLFIYIFFNLLDGERGLISFFKKKENYNNLYNEKINLENDLKETEYKISLLSDKIDLDYIEILFREKFFYGKEGEKIYIVNKNDN